MFDIVFSFTMHEHPDGFVLTIENLLQATSDLHVGVIVHTNLEMYTCVQCLLKDYKHVWVHPRPFNKGWATFSVLEGHLENIRFFHNELNESTEYYCLLASNCMFHRKVTTDVIINAFSQRSRVNCDPMLLQNSLRRQMNWYWYTHLCQNRYILKKLETLKCPIVRSYHEGTIYDAEFLNKTSNMITNWNLKSHIPVQMPFEEYLVQSLYAKESGFTPASLCIFLEKVPEIHELASIQQSCIKRVPREVDHPLRQYLATTHFNSQRNESTYELFQQSHPETHQAL